MREHTKSCLGNKKVCTYYPCYISIHEYENGWIIKPIKQKSIILSKAAGKLLAFHIRNKNQLKTDREWEKEQYRKMLDKV